MRDYFGVINGTIPKFITEELPFTDMCCYFTGYMLRYKECGCCVYEYDDYTGLPELKTECKYNKTHTEITRDTSFARWICKKSDIPLIQEKRKEIEVCIPIKSYVYLDEDHEIKYRNQDALDSLSFETNYKIFKWIILTELLVAFDRYNINDSLVFTSECI